MYQEYKRVANVVVGLDGSAKPETNDAIRKIFLQILQSAPNIQFGKIDFTQTKEELEKVIPTMNYDVCLCVERIMGESVGIGSIMQWQKLNPHIKIIMFIDDAKRSGCKVQDFYKRGYYNAIFANDFTSNSTNIIDLIINDREPKDAFTYYGLEDVEGFSYTEPTKREDIEELVYQNKEDVVENTTTSPREIKVPTAYEQPNAHDVETIQTDYPEQETMVDNNNIEENTETVSTELPNIYLDGNSLMAEYEVRIKGRIATVINNNTLVIDCPNGGLLRNREALQNREISIVLKQ